MPDRLGDYRRKRDLKATPEPKGGEPGGAAGAPRFVVQQHDASSLHWDLRLEHDGALASWALPKGVPLHPDENRLAVRTEDHPLEYLEFEGEIPAGSYGAGTMDVWDSGTYEAEKFRDDEVIATFAGDRVQGRYALFRTRGKDWMIHRMDPPADPAYEPLPERIEPMMAATAALPPDEDEYGFEVKWDGVRAVLYSDAGHVSLLGRRGSEFISRYPELRALGRALGARRVVLDGEVVALDDAGRPSFERLQSRMHIASDAAARRRASTTPVSYVIFDLLWLDGHSTLGLPYRDRRSLLDRLELEGPSWRTPAYREGDGSALLAAATEQGLEGVVAKRLDGPYRPGARSASWVKVKVRPSQEVVIGGWTPGTGGRSTSLGALAVGVHDEDGGLRYAGKVGSGFDGKALGLLTRTLEPLARDSSPFEGRQPPKETRFVEPRAVAQVEFAQWTNSGTLRAPAYKGLRDDVDPATVVREPA
jgi:bifunctional non-homologous end joining protein LigD